MACAIACACERSGSSGNRTPVAQPADLVAALNAGAAQMGTFDFSAAEATFAAALAQHPQSRDAKLDLAISILNQSSDGAQERALMLLRELLSQDPGDSRADYCAGLAQLYLGRPADALAHFRRAADANPSDAHAAYYTAQCLEQVGKESEAVPWYERAAQLEPLLRSAQLGLQRLRLRAGDEAGAAEALARFEALAQSPRSSIAEFKYTRMGSLGEVALPDTGLAASVPQGPAFGDLAPMPLAGLDQVNERHVIVGRVDLNGDGLQDLILDITGQPYDEGRSDPTAADGSRPPSQSRIMLGCAPMPGWTLASDHPLEPLDLVGAMWGDIDNDTRVDAVLLRKLATEAARAANDAGKAPDPATAMRAELVVMRQQSDGTWTETVRELGGIGDAWALLKLLADLDHDGDLDIVVVQDGGLSILYNRLDGTFERREVMAWPGDSAADVSVRGFGSVAALDVDQDGDLDLVCTSGAFKAGRTTVLLNEQLWHWRVDPRCECLSALHATSIVGFLRPGDGAPCIAALAWHSRFGPRPAEDLEVWDFGPLASGGVPHRVGVTPIGMAESLAVVDVVGSGQPSIIVTGVPDRSVISEMVRGREAFVMVHDALGSTVDWISMGTKSGYSSEVPIIVDGLGVAVVKSREVSGDAMQWLPPGPGRFPLATVSFRGRTDPAQQMRTNASGIGTRADVRVGGEWLGVRQLPWSAGALGGGQSLEPVVVGLGGAPRADFMRIDWPDSVTQTEAPVMAGPQVITETQRQISSCPVIFAWDGTRHTFITDCLGVGGIGYLVGIERDAAGQLAGVHGPPRPRESVMLGSGDAIAPRTDSRGRTVYEIRLGEPMEEACYLDAARLVAWDLPPGWSMTLDERMGIHGPEPAGEPRFFRIDRLMRAVRATSTAVSHRSAPWGAATDVDRDGAVHDVTGDLYVADFRAVDPGPADPRFIGRLQDEFVLEMEFPRPIDASPGDPMLVMDGWVEYPYSTTNFSTWQASAPAQAPTLEARDPGSGEWVTIVAEYGYPAGMPRQCSFPIPRQSLPSGCTTLRLRTTVELYIDAIAIAWNEPCAGAVRIDHPLVHAEVADAGFAARIPHPQRRPEYDYSRRAPLWDCRTQPGRYTAFGVDCAPLLRDADDASAIFAAGEEVRLSFATDRARSASIGGAPSGAKAAVPASIPGGTRVWVLEVDGWCKDMDPLTQSGTRLDPMPSRDGAGPPRAALDLMRQFNTRIEGGRD
ncbi:MAG: tetratricopeptide repeat protein [Phycisphaerales bacterium]|nr:tetratricopeptide repeat protein [Phycisphaerales bacterium]